MNNLKEFETFKGISINDNEVIVSNDIGNKEILIDFLSKIYDFEKNSSDKGKIKLNLKSLTTELKIEAFRYSLTRDDICDPYMILNMFNLIKIYNTLDDSYFSSVAVYVNSIEELLDIKLELQSELKRFAKQISVYFLSLLKSYNKTSYTPLDQHQELPLLYGYIFQFSDFLTISGIFSITESFSTDECKYIDDAFVYIKLLIEKSIIGDSLLMKFIDHLRENPTNFSGSNTIS